VDGVELWIQKYNEDARKTPLVFDHGGLGYSAYFGAVLSRLIAKGHYVIALDRRGHGRSTFKEDDVFTFDLFANNIYEQLKAVGVSKYNVVGWSDGGATTISTLLDGTISPTIEKAFLFGAFMVPSDSNPNFPNTDMYSEFVTRCAKEYSQLQPQANFTSFATKVGTLEATLPQFTNAQLRTIDGSRVRIAGAQYDEAVNLDVPAKLHAAIPGSSLVILKNVSHFAPLQDPDQFTGALEDFFYA
jgi:pimeloyl-ACP methyl ester carboxylesterase